jgi:hypothetical protein
LVWEAEEKEQKPVRRRQTLKMPRPPPAVKRDSHSFAVISSPVLISIPLDAQTPLTSPPNQQKIQAFFLLAKRQRVAGTERGIHQMGFFNSHMLFFHQLFAKRRAVVFLISSATALVTQEASSA